MSEVKTNKITSLASNNDITLDPDGTGKTVVQGGDDNYFFGVKGATYGLRYNSNTSSTQMMIEAVDDTLVASHEPLFIGGSTVNLGIAGSTKVVIASDGKVGVGETSPLGTVHIRTSDASLTNINTNADDLILENNGNCGMSICSSTSGEGNINFIDSGDTNIGRIQYNHSTNQMDFRTNDSVRMSINSAGQIATGNATVDSSRCNSGTLVVNAATTGSSETQVQIRAPQNTDSTVRNYVLFYRNDGTIVGNIGCNNSSTAYNTSSDYRLKENVADMTGAIARVKQLSPKRFSWIVDELDAANVDGFLAHEAQTVVPEAVHGTHNQVDDKDEPVYQGIDQSKLVPLLTGALQEAIAKIETLETKVAALEAGE